MKNTDKQKGAAPEVAAWAYESEEDQEAGIETIVYENGAKVKRATLSDGRVAVVRQLKGRHVNLIQSHIKKGSETGQYVLLNMYHAAKIGAPGQEPVQLPLEDLEELLAKDYTLVQMMVTALNF